MHAFEVYSWPALPFIVPVVSLLRFIVMDRIRKDMPGFVAVTVKNRGVDTSPGLKSRSP